MPKEILIESWFDFLERATEVSKEGLKDPLVFRGQTQDWPLYPALARILNKRGIDPTQAIQMETRLVEEFTQKAHACGDTIQTVNPSNNYDWWALMQQHGAPTRLLDWSTSPYVALYYAVNDFSEKNDGVVYSLDENLLNAVYMSRGETEKDIIQQIKSSVEENQPANKHLVVLVASKLTSRMIAQQSRFTVTTHLLTPHDKMAEEIGGNEVIRKWVIPYELKPKFLKNLKAMNITASALFPGIDGLGISIRELATILSTNTSNI